LRGSRRWIADVVALLAAESAWYRGRKLRRACRSIVFVLLACGALFVTPARAQDLGNCQSSRQWTWERLGENHIKLTGQVEIQCGTESMSADQVDLFTDTNTVIATGSVVFTSGSSRIAADRLEYNTRTKTGTFYNAFGTATLQEQKKKRGVAAPVQQASLYGGQEPDVYFYGEKVSKIGLEKYRLTKGGFTTCVQPTPRWRLTSGTVVLNLDHYAVLTNALFRVKGMPVLYLPIMYYPINKEDRASGFLMPLYGSSTIRGTTLSNAFYWAISRSQDATFLYDWFSKTGSGVGTEYRYVAAPGSDGQIRFYNLKEHEAEYSNSDGSTTTTPARESYQVTGNMSQRLTPKFRARGRVNYFSDITVQQTYNQNVFQSTNRQRVISGSVTGTVSSWNINGAFDHSEFFYGTTQSTLSGGTPRITFQRAEKPLFGTPLYLSIQGEGSHLLAERRTQAATIDQGLSRFDIFPRLRFPFTKWEFLSLSTSVAYRETFWTEQRDPKTGLNLPESISRHYWDLSVQVNGPVFSRIFNHPGSGYAEKLKHTIEPYFNVERVSPIDEFDHYVQLDGTDTVVGRVTRVSYGLTNNFFRKPGGPGARSSQMVSVSLGQSYYTDQRAAQYDLSYQTAYGSAPSHFSPLALQVLATPTNSMTAQFRAEYDTQFHALRTMTANGTVGFGDWLHATAGWSQRRFIEGLPGFNDPTRLDHYLNANTNWKLWDHRIVGMYNFNYDILRSRFLQQRFSTGYNAQCCGFALEYQQYNLTGISSSPVPEDHRFNFTITLAGIGTFANIFGAFGGTGGTGTTGASY
jgi:LPS-assembly protein